MKRLLPDKADARFIRRTLILLTIGLVLFAMFRAFDLLILTFGAVLGALAIHAVADGYRRRLRVPVRASVPLAMASALLAVAFLVWLFTVQFGTQIGQLVTALPRLVTDLEAWCDRSPVTRKLFDAGQAAVAGSTIAKNASGLAQGGVELLLNTVLLIVGALFIAADPGIYRRGFLLLVPPSKRAVAADALDDTGDALRHWLGAQIILMTTMGLLVGLGLWAAGVPSAAALGLLAGLSEFIPYVGPTAAMLPAIGLAATHDNGSVIWTLITFAVVRLIQTNLLTPFVQSRVVAIPPAVTLFAILGIGFVFGLFGLFFSAALLVVIFTLVRSLYLREVLGEPVDVADEKGGNPPSPPFVDGA